MSVTYRPDWIHKNLRTDTAGCHQYNSGNSSRADKLPNWKHKLYTVNNLSQACGTLQVTPECEEDLSFT